MGDNLEKTLHAFKTRTRLAFTGVTGRQQGATVFLINSQAIDCTDAFYKGERDVQVVHFCVVAVHAEGMVRAPFKYNDQRKAASKPTTKPLSALSADGGMQFWTYQPKGQDKGDRLDDETWTLFPGTTLKMFFRAEDVDKVFGGAVHSTIPAFSLCEVQLVPKSAPPCAKGWGLNVRSVSVAPFSCYSYFSGLSKLPTSAEDAKLRAIQASDSSKQMHAQIEGDSAFYVQAPICTDAYTEYVEGKELPPRKEGDAPRVLQEFVRLWNCIPGVAQCVDIPVECMQKYTNSLSVESAQRLLEVAAAVSCVSVVVYTNEYRGRTDELSATIGFPLLDTDKLLGAVCAERLVESNTFEVAASVTQFSEEAQGLWLVVGAEEDNGVSSAEQSCSDLILCESIAQCGRGVPISFVLSGDKTVLWRGYMNTSPVQMLSSGKKICPARRKWGSMENSA